MLCYCPLCADLIPKAGSLPWYQGLTPKGVGKRAWRVSSFLVRAWPGRCINWFCLTLIGRNWLKGNTHVNGMLENLVPRWAHRKPQRAFLWRKRSGEWVLGKISYLYLSVCVQSFIREGPCGLSIHNVIKAERNNVSKCSVSLQVFENWQCFNWLLKGYLDSFPQFFWGIHGH